MYSLTNFLIETSQKQYCIAILKDNKKYPIQKCTLIGNVVSGFDFINETLVQIPVNDIIGLAHTDDIENKQYLHLRWDFEICKDICKDLDVDYNSKYFYCFNNGFEKAFSIILDKPFQDITLQELKTFWQLHIDKFIAKFKTYIEDEISKSQDVEFNSELNTIIKNIDKICANELEQIADIPQLIEFWPQLLFPPPSFVKLF